MHKLKPDRISSDFRNNISKPTTSSHYSRPCRTVSGLMASSVLGLIYNKYKHLFVGKLIIRPVQIRFAAELIPTDCVSFQICPQLDLRCKVTAPLCVSRRFSCRAPAQSEPDVQNNNTELKWRGWSEVLTVEDQREYPDHKEMISKRSRQQREGSSAEDVQSEKQWRAQLQKIKVILHL